MIKPWGIIRQVFYLRLLLFFDLNWKSWWFKGLNAGLLERNIEWLSNVLLSIQLKYYLLRLSWVDHQVLILKTVWKGCRNRILWWRSIFGHQILLKRLRLEFFRTNSQWVLCFAFRSMSFDVHIHILYLYFQVMLSFAHDMARNILSQRWFFLALLSLLL